MRRIRDITMAPHMRMPAARCMSSPPISQVTRQMNIRTDHIVAPATIPMCQPIVSIWPALAIGIAGFSKASIARSMIAG